MKKYVAVDVYIDEDGALHPVCVHWDDGRRFEVQTVIEARRAASLKAGGTGIRYRCLICGQERFLYYEDPKWFVDVK
ncbi:MAG TPA: hypothetical protein P5116_00475 [Eubacteriales bacterium]|nr:hypothetical protein [Clostridia bacterium]HRV72339.1 hypothetical protein [Eubacteriales bacterium]